MQSSTSAGLSSLRLAVFTMGILSVGMVAGCGPAVGDVSGKVSYKNAPLKSGSITIMSKGGAMQGSINEDGTYVVPNVPAGDAKVTVVCNDDAKMLRQVQQASAQGRGKKGPVGAAPPAANYSLIPEIYGDLTNTPLQTTVKRGKNTFDIELK